MGRTRSAAAQPRRRGADVRTVGLSNAERAVLDLATEDAFGLWDLLWYLRAALGLEEAAAREVAAEAVSALRERGLVALHASDAAGAPGPVLPEGDAAGDVSRPRAWRRPGPGEREVLIVATAEGARVFRAAERRRR
jgi:hypothetical protein